MVQEIQLDIFKEAEKERIFVNAKIKRENESYEKEKQVLTNQIASLQQSIDTSDDWLSTTEDRNELTQLERELRYLEESHQKTIADLCAKQKS